jgi:hypothetical protein
MLDYVDKARNRVRACARKVMSRRKARVLARYLDCPGMASIDPNNMSPGWLGHDTTIGETAVIKYLRTLPVASKTFLHIGIGTGELGRTMRELGAETTGVTIAGGEIANVEGVYKSSILVNKYAASQLASALGGVKFDWIVDVNLACHACCWGHALRYFWLLAEHLAADGVLVTHTEGCGYMGESGVLLTPPLLERLAQSVGMRVTTRSDGVVLMERDE